MARHNELGKWGEKIAADLLVSKGYAIVEQNWREGRYEIDIIAMYGQRIVFVEVKSRSHPDDDPLRAIDRRKMWRMAVAANHYVRCRDIPHEVQFDIIAISGTESRYEVKHIADAFLSPLKTYR